VTTGSPMMTAPPPGTARRPGTADAAPWQPESQAQNAVVIDALASAAITYARGGYHHVVLDGITGPWFLDRLLRRARTGQIEVGYVVLRPTQAVAAQRTRGRPEHELWQRHEALASQHPASRVRPRTCPGNFLLSGHTRRT
jgi:hypothetical protein